MIRDSRQGWGWLSRLFHWLMALLVFGMLGLGFYMVRVETDLVDRYLQIQWHKSFGFTIFVLAGLRLVWRWLSPEHPQLPADTPVWQGRAARTSHVLLYALMFALPLTGWLMATASPLNDPDAFPFQMPNLVFGLFDLPDPFSKGRESLRVLFHWLHLGTAILLASLLLVHVLAALKHHFIDRDAVLRRMFTGV